MAVRPRLEDRLDLLFERALDLGNRSLQSMTESGGRVGTSPTMPSLRIRRWGNALAVDWYRIGWQGANAQEQRLPRVSRWRDKADARFATVEPEADECRGQAAGLADMLLTLGRLERAVQAHPSSPRGQGEPGPFGLTVVSGPTVQTMHSDT